jgi:hypothetical protein
VVNASLCCHNNVSEVYLVQVSLLLIGQQGLAHFFGYLPLRPIGCSQWEAEDSSNITPTPEENKHQVNPLYQ